jgi:serine phosphatase RsbU (regulator of sigma subunit)
MPVKPPRPATILVVDDSPVNLQVLLRTLEGSGHRILVATGGRAALDIAGRVRPDLVLLDVMMPDMDGFAVCRAIKSDPATGDTVVIFLSALGDVSDKVAGLRIGASDYITKPIQAEEVLARVATHLRQHQLEREVRLHRDSLDEELSNAAEMQRRILPAALPDIGSLKFAACYQTSRYAGGDYYDVIRLPDGRCGVLIADVSGHGATSAIVMAMIRTAFHAAPGPRTNPGAALKFINDQFRILWGSSLLATAIYAVIDPEALSVSYAYAGHPPPLILRGADVLPWPCEPAFPLLLMELPEVPQFEMRIEKGDRLLLFTDGITERQNHAGEMYELARLSQILSRNHALPADRLIQEIVRDVDLFAAGREPDDDQTLLLVSDSRVREWRNSGI